jgi:hypothetical protein
LSEAKAAVRKRQQEAGGGDHHTKETK